LKASCWVYPARKREDHQKSGKRPSERRGLQVAGAREGKSPDKKGTRMLCGWNKDSEREWELWVEKSHVWGERGFYRVKRDSQEVKRIREGSGQRAGVCVCIGGGIVGAGPHWRGISDWRMLCGVELVFREGSWLRQVWHSGKARKSEEGRSFRKGGDAERGEVSQEGRAVCGGAGLWEERRGPGRGGAVCGGAGPWEKQPEECKLSRAAGRRHLS
jgi:hypothetical protein